MRKYLGLLMVCQIFILTSLSYAQSYRDHFKEQVIAEEVTGSIQGVLFHPWVTVILFASVLLVIAGIFFRIYKLVAVSGLIAILITTFRIFSNQLFGNYNVFQAKLIIPIFLLTLGTKLVSDYVNKKRTENTDNHEDDSKPSHKRRKVDAPAKYKSGGSLTRFGDSTEQRSSYEKSIGGGSADARTVAAPAAKLNRSF